MTLAAPQDMPGAFAASWRARDPDALAALFASDADFVNVVGLWWEDRAAIGAAHDYGFRALFAQSRLVPGRIKTRMLGADAAVIHCRFRLSGQSAAEGGTAGPRSTVMIFVMARDKDGWHCVAAQNTDIVPGAETNEAAGGRLRPRPTGAGSR